ncbi:NADH-quinone oxidoreductase subunit NuoN [Propioniciclava soli]|uniref:NADH-quinone oxidoreductase subunit N n=1 Tax=Propioniciclava soli TaxID=2775081 RepID=A0ABZ3C9N3_9ACTN
MTVLEFAAPVLEWRALAPILLVLAAGCLGILLEAVLPHHLRFVAQMSLVLASVVLSLAFLVINWFRGISGVLAMGSITLDGPAYFLWGALLVFGALAFMVFSERRVNGGVTAFAASAAAVPGSVEEAESARAGREHTEVFPLGLFALGGMMVFLAASDLITLFVALEVFSLPLYLMCAMARRRRLLSQEAALKYFLLGAFSSGFFLMGIALLYVYSGSFDLAAIHDAVTASVFGEGLLIAGLALLGVGLLFKIGAVPFHSWTPDVYMGAPTPVTGFMAICTKLAAVGALLRVFYVALDGERWTWQPLLAIIAVLTMVVGITAALTQTDIKRLLAYSSIAHAGFILTAVVGASQIVPAGQATSAASIMFYLAAYGFATIGAFALVTMVRNPAGEENGLAGWAGLARKNPAVAGLMALFMLSFAGIPLTGGFIGKWAVFTAAWRGGYWWLVIVAALASLVGAWFYLRVIVVMFGQEPAKGTFVGSASAWTWIPVVVGAVATLWLGMLPDSVMQLATFAGTFLR